MYVAMIVIKNGEGKVLEAVEGFSINLKSL
jgi:hypothetical protein